jgi:proteic killer suppression protein
LDIVNFDKVIKKIKKLPIHIKVKLLEWAKAVEMDGIEKIRTFKGYHDEPLKGKRSGTCSIRLSKSYRAIYTEDSNGSINIITVEEVNKHDY